MKEPAFGYPRVLAKPGHVGQSWALIVSYKVVKESLGIIDLLV